MSDWFALYTKPRAEKIALHALEEKKIPVYLPVQKKIKQWSDRKKWVEEPVLKSYIFVRGDATVLERAKFTTGIVKPVMLGEKAEAIPDCQIERLKRVVESGVDYCVASACRFSPGEPVEIIEGKLTGLEGEMIERRGKNKLLIRIAIVQQVFLINIAANCLKKLSK